MHGSIKEDIKERKTEARDRNKGQEKESETVPVLLQETLSSVQSSARESYPPN